MPASPSDRRTPPLRTAPSPELRRARRAVAALFLTNGALMANLVPRYPDVKQALGLENSTYGLMLSAFPAGAILAGLAAAPVVRRLGSARAAVLGTLCTALALLLVAFTPSVGVIALMLALGGACDAITDVAQNAHGIRVQKAYGRSILNSFHALWSVGAAIGGTMAAAAIALDLPLPVHLGISGVVFAAVAVVALRFCLTGPDEEPAQESAQEPASSGSATQPSDTAAQPSARRRTPLTSHTVLMLVALVVLAIGGTLVEDSGNSWATLYVGRDLGAPGALAAIGYIAVVASQFIGRLVGDPLVNRFGQRAVARTGGVIIALGMGLALAFPSIPGTVLGFGLAGLGSATLVPAAMAQADDLPGLRHGTGLTIVSWLMRLGFLLSPPIVGAVADATSLRVGLLVVPIAGLAAIISAQVLPGGPFTRRDRS
jgi:MFS family permease